MIKLLYQVSYTRYHVSSYLWLIGQILEHCKVPKYYDQSFLKSFFLLSTLPAMIQISGKYSHLAQKIDFCHNTTNKWGRKVSRVNFWSKLNTQNTAYTKPFNTEFQRNWPALYFPKRLWKCFHNIQNDKKLKLEEEWVELRPKICLLR